MPVRFPARSLVLAFAITAMAMGGLMLLACSGGGKVNNAPRNLLLVTFDTTRADHLGCYGFEQARTPNVDALAAAGVRFEQCITPAPITLPSHASLLTGMRPIRHGARNNATHPLPPDIPTLAERLQDSGFDTGAVVSAFVLDSRYGLARGFEQYDDNLSSAAQSAYFMIRETTAENTANRAIEWLTRYGHGERWFLWVHFFDPHAEYDPPKEYLEDSPGRPYDAEISYADAQLGRLLAAVEQQGEMDETLVVMTSDHGESLGEHGERTHGFFIYDATTRVPLLFTHPSLAAGTIIKPVCGTVDIAPTVCALLGVDFADEDFDGIDLFAGGDGGPARHPVYQESMVPFFNHGWSDLRALRSNNARFIRAPTTEYQPLGMDSDATLLDEDSETVLEQQLANLLAAGERGLHAQSLTSMSVAERAAMAALGYVWDDGDDSIPTSDLADPKDKVAEWERNQEIYELVRREEWVEAETVLRSLIADAPGALDPHKILARVLEETGRIAEARTELLTAAALPGADTELFVRLAELSFTQKLEWQVFLAEARRRNSADPSPWVMEGNWWLKLGDPKSADIAFRSALGIDPSCAAAWSGRGRLLHMEGDLEAAAEALDRAIAADPNLPEAWFGRGVVAMAQRNLPHAEQMFVRATEIKPDYANAYANLGSIYFRQEKLGEAEQAWKRALRIKPNHKQAKKNLELLK